jgi:hypothetical protein
LFMTPVIPVISGKAKKEQAAARPSPWPKTNLERPCFEIRALMQPYLLVVCGETDQTRHAQAGRPWLSCWLLLMVPEALPAAPPHPFDR